MAEISKITLPSGTTYDIKDTTARAMAGGGIQLKGTTTTPLTDEATTNPIMINGSSYTAISQDAVFYGKKEFVFDGTKWHEFGDMSGLGALATKDSASGSFTPSGSVTLGLKKSIAVVDSNGQNYKPAGSIGLGTTGPSDVVVANSGEATYTPEGSVSVSTKTWNSVQTNVSFSTVTGTPSYPTYTPTGSVSAPTISVNSAGSTTTIKNPTSVTVAKTVVAAAPGATAPSNAITYYSVTGETLSLYQLGYTTGASITTSDTTVKTGDASYTASAPTFSGTMVRATTGYQEPLTYQASFTGTGVHLETDKSIPSSATFVGTSATLKTETEVPSTATFTGTEGTVTVS